LLGRHEANQFMSMLRTLEISDRQQHYKWFDQSQDGIVYSDLPGYVSAATDINLLPVDLLTDTAKELEKRWIDHKGGKFSLLKSFAKLFSSRKGSLTVEFEKSLADTIQQKYQHSKHLVHVIRHWREDEEFAQQLFNSTHPSQIVRLETIPECFAELTDNLVRDQLGPDQTLQQELKAGHLFMISYPHLDQFAKLCFVDDLDNNEASAKPKSKTPVAIRYISSPSVLLYYKQGVHPSLVPLAIRLTPAKSGDVTPEPDITTDIPAPQSVSLMFTRRDNVGSQYTDWLVAKMWVRVADVHYRLLGCLIGCRLLAETVSLAVYRCLPSVHPVYKLLVPHLADIAALNTVYRRHVLDPSSGLADVLALGDRGRGHCIQFVAAFLKTLTIDHLDVRENFARLGLIDETLPGYWYREDALTLWDAIWKFVEDVLSIYYTESATVCNDDELKAMMQEMRQHGLASLGLNEQFSTVEELTQFVTIFIFVCTVQQTALRRSMIDIYSYCPNAPPCMMTAPPSERHPEGYTEQQMREMLPSPDLVEKFIECATMLAGDDKPAKVALACYKDKLFTEEAPLKAIDRFCSRLRQISDSIRSRNKGQLCPFEYLQPENIYQCYDS
jgi:arachidonate 5-lipoxygenase